MNTLTRLTRLQQILIALLAVQLALGVVVFWPDTAATAGSGPLFADLKANKVTKLVIRDGDNRLALARNDDEWVLPEADDYPAKGDAITTLLEKIEKIDTSRLVAQTETSHNRLQVADDNFSRQVELTLEDGATHRLTIGSSAGAAATHVRGDNVPQVYLTGELQAWDANAQAASWIDTLYFSVPQTATVKLTLENANGTFEFERAGENWAMADLSEDEVFNETEFNTLFNQVRSVRMVAPIGKQAEDWFGLDAPQATVTLQTDADTYTLHVGAQDPDTNNYVLKASGEPYYVYLSQATGNNLIQKTRADFLQQPEEGTDNGTIQTQ